MDTGKRMLLLEKAPYIIPPALLSRCGGLWDARCVNRADPTRWPDLSGHARDLTMSNFAGTAHSGWNPAKPERLVHDGVDDYALYTEAALNPVHTDISAIIAFRLPSVTEAYPLFLTDGSSNVLLFHISAGSFNIISSDSVSGGVYNAYTVLPNTTYFMAASYSQAAKKSTLRVNGALVNVSPTALTNGLRAVNRVSLSVNAALTTRTPQSTFMAAIFPGYALTAGDYRELWRCNHVWLGI